MTTCSLNSTWQSHKEAYVKCHVIILPFYQHPQCDFATILTSYFNLCMCVFTQGSLWKRDAMHCPRLSVSGAARATTMTTTILTTCSANSAKCVTKNVRPLHFSCLYYYTWNIGHWTVTWITSLVWSHKLELTNMTVKWDRGPPFISSWWVSSLEVDGGLRNFCFSCSERVHKVHMEKVEWSLLLGPERKYTAYWDFISSYWFIYIV